MDDVDILLVEDNDGDVRLTEQAFETRELPGTLHIVQTGDKALDRLLQRGEFAEAPRIDRQAFTKSWVDTAALPPTANDDDDDE